MILPARLAALFVFAAALCAAPNARAQTFDLTREQQRLHDIYKELVEIETTAATGDTAKAARAMAAHLWAAGFRKSDAEVFVQAPRKGDLVARLTGNGTKRPLLLIAHLDVVPAAAADWSTDPFTLVEKDGFYYARGSIDDKAMGAIFLANLIRYKKEGAKFDRDIIVALTTDEETPESGQDGVAWLLKNKRDLIDAEFALNEGGGGALKHGKPFTYGVQTGEKLYVNYWLEVHAPGGHSSVPSKDTAIYRLAAGLGRLDAFDFPVRLNDTTRATFARMASLEEGQRARDMAAVAKAKPARKAVARLAQVPYLNAQLRTTCVATRLEGGHADNALPQTRPRARQLPASARRQRGRSHGGVEARRGRRSNRGQSRLRRCLERALADQRRGDGGDARAGGTDVAGHARDPLHVLGLHRQPLLAQRGHSDIRQQRRLHGDGREPHSRQGRARRHRGILRRGGVSIPAGESARGRKVNSRSRQIACAAPTSDPHPALPLAGGGR